MTIATGSSKLVAAKCIEATGRGVIRDSSNTRQSAITKGHSIRNSSNINISSISTTCNTVMPMPLKTISTAVASAHVHRCSSASNRTHKSVRADTTSHQLRRKRYSAGRSLANKTKAARFTTMRARLMDSGIKPTSHMHQTCTRYVTQKIQLTMTTLIQLFLKCLQHLIFQPI